MSEFALHFALMVFTKENGKNPYELLEPFYAGTTCQLYVKYTKEQAVAKVRKEIEACRNNWYKRYLADTEVYEREHSEHPDHIEFLRHEFPKRLNWTDEECYQHEKQYYDDEMIGPDGELMSKLNSDAKYVYYIIGGRWHKYLKTQSGKRTDQANIRQVDWTNTVPFAFISPDGTWHERGSMSWSGCIVDGKKKEDWEAEFKQFLQQLDDDVTVTIVDCHI